LIFGNLKRSVFDRHDAEANNNMAMASLNAGIAFSNAILGAGHAMTHQIDGLLDTHHGETNATLLPHVMQFNLPKCRQKFTEIARQIEASETGQDRCEDLSEQAIEAVRRLTRDIGLHKSLADVGLKKESIKTLSQNALNDACLVTNPRNATAEDIEQLFLKAF
jgi:1,3-propanediol dehydrogenase